MENEIILDGVTYKCIICSDKQLQLKQENNWSSKDFFVKKLLLLENELIKSHNIIDKLNGTKINETCTVCEKNIAKFYFKYKNMIWSNGLTHYVETHNIKPPSKFIKFVLDNDPTIKEKCKKSFINISGTYRKINKFSYVKIKSNQLMILDALMEHGGYEQKYKERHETGYKYSEHAGVLEFNKGVLDRVLISGHTQRSKQEDEEIFFPITDKSALVHEYIFHTHPPTPTPGGRINEGILYEIPSIMDLWHFVEHFNYGRTQGSIVITPEGLYNIRKYIFDKQPLQIDFNIGNKLRDKLLDLQDEAIDKFKKKFNEEYFYSIIAQDMTFINKWNEILKKIGLYIDYFPRQKTKLGHWIIGTIYLPICSIDR